ncbi:hypothetical protein ANACAC_01900 [Anaerostipes caccae L1-92]|uniref:Uncharacterized protein n=1 Tax=Anaerostipes caccae (strain DSM 14662 / CCUG 47493 / JCM 13470 / NCIMB 13811 / L1-92) TaxID=411490 RepID=B0MEA5_ANACD|nr:hypothetical protein ANACAC_01900 [Anaerostipes caccae L1-92]
MCRICPNVIYLTLLTKEYFVFPLYLCISVYKCCDLYFSFNYFYR